MKKKNEQTCVKCPSFDKATENIGYCRRFKIEIWMSLARKTKLCRDFELHHAMPNGKLVPVKRR